MWQVFQTLSHTHPGAQLANGIGYFFFLLLAVNEDNELARPSSPRGGYHPFARALCLRSCRHCWYLCGLGQPVMSLDYNIFHLSLSLWYLVLGMQSNENLGPLKGGLSILGYFSFVGLSGRLASQMGSIFRVVGVRRFDLKLGRF